MLTLHLIRHAKTHPVSSTGQDKDRELMEKGIAQANLLGHYLQTHHVGLGKILCSAATRTRQTKSVLCQHLQEKCRVEFRDGLYHASQQELLQELAPETEQTLTLIGHNEGISDLATYFVDEMIGMQTCEMLTLHFPFETWASVSAATAVISFRYRPEAYLP